MRAHRLPDTFRGVEMFDLIGETLRRLRKDRGMTLDELGKAAKLGRGQLSRIENNHQKVTLASLAKVLASLGVSRQEFFRRYDAVESEVRSVKRQAAGGALAEGDWPQEIREVLGKVESLVQITLGQPRPVAQGAFELGEFVVLFRVVSKNAEPPAPPEERPQPKPRGTGGGNKPGRRRKG